MRYTIQDIQDAVDSATYRRGLEYQQRGKVLSAQLDGTLIEGSVSGSGRQSYQQTISVAPASHGINLDGSCTCPMEYNCKHVVAVLLELLPRLAPAGPRAPATVVPPVMAHWLQQLAQAAGAAAPKPQAKPRQAGHRLVYVLMPDPRQGRLLLLPCKARLRVGGEIAAATVVSELHGLTESPPAYVQRDDHYPLQILGALYNRYDYSTGAAVEPRGPLGAQLLRLLLESGRLLWAEVHADLQAGRLLPMQAGPARAGRLGWHADAARADVLTLGWQFEDGAPLPGWTQTDPPMYAERGMLGELSLPDLPPGLTLEAWRQLVQQAPSIAAHERLVVTRHLYAQGLEHMVPLPQALERRVRDDIAPHPVLLLASLPRPDAAPGHHDGWHDFALLAFDYDGLRAVAGSADVLERLNEAGTETIQRDPAAEARAGAELTALGFRAIAAAPHLHGMQGLLELDSQQDWLRFAAHALPRLRAQGWLVDYGPGYRYDLSAVEDWYAELGQDAGGGNDWLDLELGVIVDGARVSLLPVLVQLIRRAPRDFDPTALEARADGEMLIAELPGGRRVALEWGRVKPILRALGELYFSDAVGEGVRVPLLDSARLAELEAGAQLRWLGGQHLLELGRRLRAFEQVRAVAAPAGLQGSLRPYQSEGLAWMQFLREYGLAGILADDMGLGKTIQTLAHVLAEKEAGRLDAPALVVAPTSLMSNWQEEAARFAPGLRVLLLHGPERLRRFEDIAQADLVLTSYALLPRDEAELRRRRYHLLILDEAQYIKNSRSKAAQTAILLDARHRLCLTGTPLQNHLGELWSQFHFLMPGLLGDEKRFNADFRAPIEKQGDGARNAFLIRRIKPFLLRRTKDLVATELPPKTEMVRHVDLAGPQRDLYETVRLAMDRKVREEIARKGVARSQIVILEALLKLRQVCCDPRLVKLTGQRAGGVASAKLEALLELMDELLDEGRKILVFSQFTSMLALIEAELRARGVGYALLTGDTVDRAAQVAAFQQGAVPVFLISLKAGGVGLNLTAADTVIHYDPWWNPAAENQATDRAWRIGQDKPVFVYRLIARGTLEEKIQELQRKKASLADAVLAGGEMPGLQISQEDLLTIFEPLS